jgi:hypothetical protein
VAVVGFQVRATISQTARDPSADPAALILLYSGRDGTEGEHGCPLQTETSGGAFVTLRMALGEEPGVQVIRLAGWLEGEAVAELERVVSGCAEPLRIDLAELRSADPAGLTVLRALRARGARLVGASPYIRLLLGTAPSGPPPSGGPGRKGRKA